MIAFATLCDLLTILIAALGPSFLSPFFTSQAQYQMGGGGGVSPYVGYIGMCCPRGYGLPAVLIINSISILAILVINRAWLLHSSLELGEYFQ